MRVSRLYKAPIVPETERIPLARVLLWGALAAAVILGVVLFFLHARTAPTVL